MNAMYAENVRSLDVILTGLDSILFMVCKTLDIKGTMSRYLHPFF